MRVLSNLTPKRCKFLKDCFKFLADKVKSLFTNKRATKFVLRALKSVKSVFKSFGRVIKNSKDKLLNSFMSFDNNNNNTNQIIEEVQEIEDIEMNYDDESFDIDSKLDYISNYVKEIDLMIHAYRFSDFFINILSCAWTTLSNFDQAVKNYIKSESASLGHENAHNHDFLNKSTYELLNFTLKKIQDLLVKPEAKSWVQDIIKFLCDAANFPLS
jgi:coenzyme F420-reducing hydrogenase alpha subunit